MYASPGFVHAYAEQLSGCAPTPVNLAKADSYSVGVTLFEALTGRLPVPEAVTSCEEASVHFRRQVCKCWRTHGHPAVLSRGGALTEHAMQ